MELAPNLPLSKVQVVEQDTRKATGLYGNGDRSDFVLRILAVGKRAYAEDGLRMPRPTGFTQERWDKVLAGLPEPPSREGKPEETPSTCLPQEWRQAVAARETKDGYWDWAARRWREVKAAKMAGEETEETETANSLQRAYGGYWGEVLSCPVQDWQRTVAEGPTRDGYWEWAFMLRRERRERREKEREGEKEGDCQSGRVAR